MDTSSTEASFPRFSLRVLMPVLWPWDNSKNEIAFGAVQRKQKKRTSSPTLQLIGNFFLILWPERQVSSRFWLPMSHCTVSQWDALWLKIKIKELRKPRNVDLLYIFLYHLFPSSIFLSLLIIQSPHLIALCIFFPEVLVVIHRRSRLWWIYYPWPHAGIQRILLHDAK